MKFHVGQKVWVHAQGVFDSRSGEVVPGTHGTFPGEVVAVETNDRYGVTADIPNFPEIATKPGLIDGMFLSPRDDGDYDGNRVTSWDKCPWKPERVAA